MGACDAPSSRASQPTKVASPADPRPLDATAPHRGHRLAKAGGKSLGYGDAEAAESSGDEAAPGDEPGTPAGGGAVAPPLAPAAHGDAGVVSVAATKRRFGFTDAEGGDDEEGGGLRRMDDADEDLGRTEGGAPASREALRDMGFVARDELVRHTEQTGEYVREVHGLAPPQPPFQAGSTSFGSGGSGGSSSRMTRRYLVWNSFGVVTCRREALGNAIVVDFADAAKHRPLSLMDQMSFSIADVKEAGLVLCSRYLPPQSASPGDASDEGVPSYILFKPLTGVASEWRLELPVYKPRVPAARFPVRAAAASARRSPSAAAAATPDPEDADLDTSDAAESALAAAVGDGWVAVATDRQLVRFFRTSGLQVRSGQLPAPPPEARRTRC